MHVNFSHYSVVTGFMFFRWCKLYTNYIHIFMLLWYDMCSNWNQWEYPSLVAVWSPLCPLELTFTLILVWVWNRFTWIDSILLCLLSDFPFSTGRGPIPTLTFTPWVYLPDGHCTVSCNPLTPHHLVLLAHPTPSPRLQEITGEFVACFPAGGINRCTSICFDFPPLPLDNGNNKHGAGR